MLRKDRVLLRNVTIAVVLSTLGAVAIGTNVLGRHAETADKAVSSTTTTTSADENAISTAGGSAAAMPAEPASSTNITSTTIIVNPAVAAPPADNQTPAQPNQTVIVQQPAPTTGATTQNQAAPQQTANDTAGAPDQTQQVPQIIPVPVPIGNGDTSSGITQQPLPPGQVPGPYPNVGRSDFNAPQRPLTQQSPSSGQGILGAQSPNGGSAPFSADPSSPNTPPGGRVAPIQQQRVR